MLVIGLDGVTWQVLKPLVERGLMPNLGQLMATGYHSTLMSTIPPMSASAWTTFITGVNPGKHGILQFVNLKAGAAAKEQVVEIFPGGFAVVNARSIREPTLWQRLSQAGLRVGIINVPMTYPPEPVNGFMITCMLTPPGARNFTYPPELADELDDDYEIDLPLHEREFHFDADRFLDRLVEVMEKRGRAALQLMEQHEWDFFMVVFTTTDRLQHRFWKVLVPGYPEYDAPEAADYRARLEEYHHRLDACLGHLVTAAGQGIHVMVLSDHGFGPIADWAVHKQALLHHLNLAGQGGKAPIVRLRSLIEGKLGLTVSDVRRYLNRLMPRKAASWVESQARQAEHRVRSRDRAYLVSLQENIGGVFFNPQVADDRDNAQLEALKQAVTNRLYQLTIPETGEPLVCDVYRREELYSGERLDECPDLIFVLKQGYGLAGGVAPGGQLISARRQEPQKQGTHRQDGILVLTGPAIQPQAAREPEQLIDVTATILYLLAQPIPANMDSRVMTHAIQADFLTTHPILTAEYSQPAGGSPPAALESVWESKEEARLIEDRLRGIGYLE
jgi:predicted AlkP superfamily phosphohydrolase/phosphomutase